MTPTREQIRQIIAECAESDIYRTVERLTGSHSHTEE